MFLGVVAVVITVAGIDDDDATDTAGSASSGSPADAESSSSSMANERSGLLTFLSGSVFDVSENLTPPTDLIAAGSAPTPFDDDDDDALTNLPPPPPPEETPLDAITDGQSLPPASVASVASQSESERTITSLGFSSTAIS